MQDLMQNHSPGDLQGFLLGAAVTAQSTRNLPSHSGLACVRVNLDKVQEQQDWPQHSLPQLHSEQTLQDWFSEKSLLS